MIRILIANVYFSPSSFGGATIVAEEVALQLRHLGYLPLILTSFTDNTLPGYHIVRYQTKGLDVVAINIPNNLAYDEVYRNTKVAEIFREVARSFKPNILHLHSIQRLGAEIAISAKEMNIPYVITLHDCWWLCERQFMINKDGVYCHQEEIQESICRYCVDDSKRSSERFTFLRRVLEGADKLLFPSKFHRDLHIKNSLEPSRSHVNRNGIRFPATSYSRHTGPRIVFGYVGGPGAIKGSTTMLEAFKNTTLSEYDLITVDAAQNLGKSWSNQMSQWKISGNLIVSDAYTQETIDDFFSRIDVLLFPSQWKESFGLTVREALARDIWVIATDGGGTVEDIINGENGEIVPLTPDPQPLANAIERCNLRQWGDYKNPYKNKIQSYKGQACELDVLFRDAIARHDKDGTIFKSTGSEQKSH